MRRVAAVLVPLALVITVLVATAPDADASTGRSTVVLQGDVRCPVGWAVNAVKFSVGTLETGWRSFTYTYPKSSSWLPNLTSTTAGYKVQFTGAAGTSVSVGWQVKCGGAWSKTRYITITFPSAGKTSTVTRYLCNYSGLCLSDSQSRRILSLIAPYAPILKIVL